MKKFFLNLFLFVVTYLSCNYGYSEPSFQDSLNTAPPSTVSKQELPVNTKQQPSLPPKNYLDIKVEEKDGDRFLSEFINMLTTLGVIVAIILIATWFLKRMVNTKIEQLNTTSLIKIVERRTLTPKTSLYLVDIKGAGFILAESINGVTSLGSFDVNEIEKPTSFNGVMKSKSDEPRS